MPLDKTTPYASYNGVRQQKKKSQLQNKQRTMTFQQSGKHSVFYMGECVTPKCLCPFDENIGRSRKVTDIEQKMNSESKTLQLNSLLRMAQVRTIEKDVTNYISFYTVEDVSVEPELKDDLSPDEMIAFNYISGESMMTPTSESTLFLTETPTIILLDLASMTVNQDSTEAALVLADNEKYDYLLNGMGHNRKVVDEYVQTLPVMSKTRETDMDLVYCHHTETFSCTWELYEASQKDNIKEREQLRKQVNEKSTDINEQDQMQRLMSNERFHTAVTIMERLLANNNYNEQQKRFRGLIPDERKINYEQLEFNYKLNLLWTFSNFDTHGKCVNAIVCNPANDDIYAVGYGKYNFIDKCMGMVLLWNIKNPAQPERQYHFDDPVTSLDFSQVNFNLLAVGFYTGKVLILDVSDRDLKVICCNRFQKDRSFEPIWQVHFLKKEKEHLYAICQNGRMTKFYCNDSVYMRTSNYVQLSRCEGQVKGIHTMRRCLVDRIPIVDYSAALSICFHPYNAQIYYIGTNEGVIHKCSMNHRHNHYDAFLAHEGPIYDIQFSPFCNKLFLTCGDDWFVRVWCDGIDEPLFGLTKSMSSVMGASWSPTISTVIASTCGSEICLWDIQRKIHVPQSVTDSPSGSRNTVIKFSKTGNCLIVGDVEGNVHVYALEEMPFPPFYQQNLLEQALGRLLLTRPDLMRKLKKTGGLNMCNS